MEKITLLRNNGLIKLFGVLFMTLNLIIVVIGGVSYVYTVQIFKKAIAEYNLSSIENVRSLMDLRLASGEKLAQDIYLSVNLGDLASEASLESPNARLLVTKLIDTIRYGVDINSVVTDAYVYLAKSETVVSNTGFYEAQYFYENYVSHKDTSFEAWKNMLVRDKRPTYSNAQLVFPNYEISLTEYRRPFNSYISDIYGCIVVNYDNQAIVEILNKSNLLSKANTQIRYLPTQTPLLSVGDNEINTYLQTQDIAAGQHTLNDTPFGKLIVIKQTSLNRDWEYLTAIRAEVFYHRTNALVGVMVAIVVVQVLLGGFLACLFSTRSYRPIRRMTDKIRAMADDFSIPGSGNDMQDIQNITSRAIGDYGKIKDELESVRPMIVKSFLTQLLHGNGCERDYAYNNLGQTRDLFAETGFICAKMYVEDCSEFVQEQSIEEMQLAKLVLTNITEEVFEPGAAIVSLDFDLRNVVFIFNVPWTEEEAVRREYMLLIDRGFKKCQALIVEKFKIYTSVGVSLLHRDLPGLYPCHNQAQRALNEKIASGMYGINYYTERADSSNGYSYSLEDEVYLINSAKTGDFPKVKEILDAIVEENASVFAGNAFFVAQCFVVDLVSTLLRVTSEMNVPDTVMHLNISAMLSAGSNVKIMEELYGHYEVLCEWINKNKKSHNTEMKNRIIAYIRTHCLDHSLSLVSVADHMGINPTYLSVFIKEQLGDTFLAYVLSLRMEKAKELLIHTDLSLQDIALQIGYANSGVFIRVFKKKFGYTPGAFRTHSAQ